MVQKPSRPLFSSAFQDACSSGGEEDEGGDGRVIGISLKTAARRDYAAASWRLANLATQ